MKLHHIILAAMVFAVVGVFHSMETMPKPEPEPTPEPIPSISLEQHQHEMICLEARLRCELREDKAFPCMAAYGDQLFGNVLIETTKSCD